MLVAAGLWGGAAHAAGNILVFGDSLSAGYGIPIEKSWPSLLDRQLQQLKPPYRIANASISGETSAGGLARLPAALKRFKPSILVLALGANDGLRGLPPTQLQDNLLAMVRQAKASGARVLLVGIRLPPNYGPDYTQAFDAAFTVTAKREKVALLPFLLEPIALNPDAFQADRLHPVAAVQPQLSNHVYAALKPLLR